MLKRYTIVRLSTISDLKSDTVMRVYVPYFSLSTLAGLRTDGRIRTDSNQVIFPWSY